MRVLTVRQPHAWAIIHAGKTVENRSTNVAGNYRGPIAIHAGLHIDKNPSVSMGEHKRAHGTEVPTELHFGAIIGIVDLVDVHPSGNFQHPCGCNTKWRLRTGYHLVLANPRALKTPIPYTGALGLRTITDPNILEELEVIE